MSKDVITRLKAVDEMSGPIGQISRNFGKFNQQCLSLTGIAGGVSKTLAGMATSFMGPVAAVTALTGTISHAVKLAKDFEQSNASLAAVLGTSADKISDLSDNAKQLGATTRYTAGEITSLQTELAKLGFNQNEILNATKAVQGFATATGGDLAGSAALCGAALRAFGLDATEMDRVASAMAVSTTKSALSFESLQNGLSTVAPVAKAFGFSIEDTLALLGQLANAGFDASSAATATRNIFLNLADANGKLAQALGRPIKSLDDLAPAFEELKNKGIDLNTALELTDKRSVAAFQTFLDGSDKVLKLRDAVSDCSSELQDMAETKAKTLEGSLTMLGSAWDGFMLNLAESKTGVLKETVDALTDLVTKCNEIFTDLGRIQAKAREINGGGNGSKSRVDRDLDTLRGSNHKEAKNADINNQYIKEANVWRERLRQMLKEGIAWQTFDGKSYSQSDVRDQIRAIEKVQKEYQQKAAAIMKPTKDTTPGAGQGTTNTTVYDDSTDQGIKAHIKALQEQRDQVKKNTVEYGNLTAEITRLQNLLKNPDKTNTAEKTRIQEINAEIAKLEKEYISADETTRKTITDKIWWLDAEKQGIQSLVKAAHDMPQDVASQLGKDINGMSYVITKPPVFDEAAMKEWSKEIQDALKEVNKNNPTTAALSAVASDIQEQMSHLDVTSGMFANLKAQLTDNTNLQTIINTVLENGFNFQDLNIDVDALWNKIINGKDVKNADWQGIVDAINEKLKELKIDPIKIDFQTGEIKTDTKKEEDGLKNVQKHAQGVSSALTAASNAFGQYASESEEAAAAQKAFTIAAAIATLVGQFAAIPKGVGIWSWIAGTIAGTATLIATIAQIKSSTNSYAEGGVVPGNSYVGDAVPILANSQEVILNASQQEMLASNLQSAQQNAGGGGRSTISGEQIVTVVNAFGRRTGRGEILR